MILQVALGAEGLLAAGIRALKDLLLPVDLLVSDQVRALSEGFATVGPGAPECLGSHVQLNVGPQAAGPVKFSFTAINGTLVDIFPSPLLEGIAEIALRWVVTLEWLL